MDSTEENTGASAARRAARWSLHGQTALVTGGTRGIGRAVVEELAGLGAALYTCSRTEAELAECLKRWEGSGLRVFGSVCDLSVKEQREELLRKAGEAFDGKINILVLEYIQFATTVKSLFVCRAGRSPYLMKMAKVLSA